MTSKRETFGPSARVPSSAGSARVSVERLSLRVPGRGSAFGQRIANGALERVAARLPAGLRGNIAGLKLNVRPSRMSEEGLTEAIADAVLRALGRSRP